MSDSSQDKVIIVSTKDRYTETLAELNTMRFFGRTGIVWLKLARKDSLELRVSINCSPGRGMSLTWRRDGRIGAVWGWVGEKRVCDIGEPSCLRCFWNYLRIVPVMMNLLAWDNNLVWDGVIWTILSMLSQFVGKTFECFRCFLYFEKGVFACNFITIYCWWRNEITRRI